MVDATDLGIEGITDAVIVGSGGNADVYRARQPELDRSVAVKVIRGMADEDARRRFSRECKAMGRLSATPGIVPVYQYGFTPAGSPYLIMPFHEGGSLQDRLQSHGPFSWPDALELTVTCARAVHEAHELGVLHRDLKPANILMSASGAPVVSDFGIARITGSDTGMLSAVLTLTPAFSPPEAIDGSAPTRQADIYSLGAMLFALLAGRPPFTTSEGGTAMLAVMKRISEEDVEDLRATVPAPICDAYERAMRKEPSERHQSAAQFADELEAARRAIESGGAPLTHPEGVPPMGLPGPTGPPMSGSHPGPLPSAGPPPPLTGPGSFTGPPPGVPGAPNVAVPQPPPVNPPVPVPQPFYGGVAGPATHVAMKSDGMATASLVLGIMSLVLCVFVIFGPIGLVLGIKAPSMSDPRFGNKSTAIAGITTSAIGTVLSLLFLLSAVTG